MSIRRSLLALPAAIALLGLAACAGEAATGDTPPVSDGDGHSDVAGAEEVAEAPLALLSVDADGEVGLLDLIDGAASDIGTVGEPLAFAGDGRYGFVSTVDGLEIVDSGRWTWIHGDHDHYYRGEPRLIGTLPGGGVATVASGLLSTAGSTGVFFAESGHAVLLDNASLADGEVVERFRVPTGADAGLVAPLDDGALVTIGDELVFHDATGVASGWTTVCDEASGAMTTNVGLVVGCADGAVLATWDDDAPVFERIPYPGDAEAEPATAFDGRTGRPTVAGAAGTTGFWLLDTRALAWRYVATDVALARVAAIDDADGHVVALDVDGRMRVYLAGSGEEAAATEPLVSEVDSSVSLSVDERRAYVNDAEGDTVIEIDFADGARIARTLETPTSPEFVTEVGR